MNFNRIDETENPGEFITFLDIASRNEGIKAMKSRTYELLDAREGQKILEVGCGTGDDARQIAEMISPGGTLVAIDKSEALIAEARRRSRRTNDSIDFVVGDATRLDLESATFDACRIERTLIHIPEPAAAMKEMLRVLRNGGKLVAYEPDLEAYVIDSSYKELSRRLLGFWYGQLKCGWIARHLPALFKECGLADIKGEPRSMISNWEATGSTARWKMQSRLASQRSMRCRTGSRILNGLAMTVPSSVPTWVILSLAENRKLFGFRLAAMSFPGR